MNSEIIARQRRLERSDCTESWLPILSSFYERSLMGQFANSGLEDIYLLGEINASWICKPLYKLASQTSSLLKIRLPSCQDRV